MFGKVNLASLQSQSTSTLTKLEDEHVTLPSQQTPYEYSEIPQLLAKELLPPHIKIETSELSFTGIKDLYLDSLTSSNESKYALVTESTLAHQSLKNKLQHEGLLTDEVSAQLEQSQLTINSQLFGMAEPTARQSYIGSSKSFSIDIYTQQGDKVNLSFSSSTSFHELGQFNVEISGEISEHEQAALDAFYIKAQDFVQQSMSVNNEHFDLSAIDWTEGFDTSLLKGVDIEVDNGVYTSELEYQIDLALGKQSLSTSVTSDNNGLNYEFNLTTALDSPNEQQDLSKWLTQLKDNLQTAGGNDRTSVKVQQYMLDSFSSMFGTSGTSEQSELVEKIHVQLTNFTQKHGVPQLQTMSQLADFQFDLSFSKSTGRRQHDSEISFGQSTQTSYSKDGTEVNQTENSSFFSKQKIYESTDKDPTLIEIKDDYSRQINALLDKNLKLANYQVIEQTSGYKNTVRENDEGDKERNYTEYNTNVSVELKVLQNWLQLETDVNNKHEQSYSVKEEDKAFVPVFENKVVQQYKTIEKYKKE